MHDTEATEEDVTRKIIIIITDRKTGTLAKFKLFAGNNTHIDIFKEKLVGLNGAP